MSNFPGLPALGRPLEGTDTIMVGDGIYGREITASELMTAVGASVGNSTPLAAWNETDLVQWSVDQTPPAPAITSGLTTPAFTNTGGVITVGAASVGAAGFGVYWLDGEYPLEEIDSLRLFIGPTIPTLGDEVLVGLTFMGDSVSGNSMSWMTGFDSAGAPKSVVTRFDAPGGAVIAGTSTGGAGWLTLRVKGSVPGGTYPKFLLMWEFVAFDGSRTDGVTSSDYIDTYAPWTASWDTAACNKVGVILYSTLAANPISAAFTDLTVIRRQA